MRSLSTDTLLLEQRVGFFGCPTKAKEPTKASSVSDLKKKLSVKASVSVAKCHKKKRHVVDMFCFGKLGFRPRLWYFNKLVDEGHLI